jgi:hypothetical protein
MFSFGQPITIVSDDEWSGVQGIVEHIWPSGTLSVAVEGQEERIGVEPWETMEYINDPDYAAVYAPNLLVDEHE